MRAARVDGVASRGCKGIELVANVRAYRAVLRRVHMTARLPRAAAAERSECDAGRKALRQFSL